jgi:hypothetical protein
MKTLYEQFMECKQSRNTDVCNNPLVRQQLVELFQKTYDITLPSVDIFTPDVSSIGEQVSIGYKFPYGSVKVATADKRLEVTFFHNDQIKAPFQANRCVITVDDNLNFIKAEYSMYFAFLNSILHNSAYGGYNQLLIQRIIDLSGAYNHLSFRDGNDIDDCFTDAERCKLDERFFTPNPELEDDFYKLIDFATEYPHDFYARFDGYPTFNQCVEHSDSIIDFINVFIHQYFNDNERLKQNLLLIDMETI